MGSCVSQARVSALSSSLVKALAELSAQVVRIQAWVPGWLTMLPETKETLETAGFQLPGEALKTQPAVWWRMGSRGLLAALNGEDGQSGAGFGLGCGV